jgi:hypothetical protein
VREASGRETGSVASVVVELTRSAVDDALVDAFARLSVAEYGAGSAVADPAHLRWKFLDDPAGAAYADTLTESGAGVSEVFGRIVYEPRLMRSAAGERRAVNPIDLLIHPEHRSPRAFLQLMRGLREHAGVDLVYLSPNDTSAPLYERVLKFTEVGTFVLTGTPLRPDRVLGDRLPRWLGPPARLGGAGWRGLLRLATSRLRHPVEVSDRVPDAEELDRLATEISIDTTWVGTRDHEFHQWRFREGPRFEYRVRYARIGDELVGYLAARIAEFEGLRACVAVDCVVVGADDAKVARALLADLLRWAIAERTDLIAALTFGESHLTRSLRRFPMLRVPRRFWPQQAPLLAEWTSGTGNGVAPDLALTLADLDVF